GRLRDRGVRLALDFLQWLQTSEANSPSEILHSWFLIPCLNVDGYLKNSRTNANGVDLNRNFPSSDWSPEAKAPRYSPGPNPASELEIQALVQLIEIERPSLIVHFHSWEPCIVYTGAAGKAAAQTLAGSTGYEVREDIGYPTPGSLGQYGWLDCKTPVVCIEEKEHAPLETVWSNFKPGLTKLMTTELDVSNTR
ncbi:MAG: murein peptide amidase A, partial [Proteobacteria bacterium]